MTSIDLKTLLVCGLCSFCSASLMAQTGLPGEEVEVIKDFDARLVDARKLRIQPKLPPIDTSRTHYSYNISVDNPEIDYAAPTIRPLAIPAGKRPAAYQGALRGGYGFPNAILAHGSYYFTPAEGLNLGIDVKHASANDKDVPLQRFMDNDIALTGTYFTSPSLSVNGKLSYSFDDTYFYGVDPTDLTFYIDDKRRFKTFKGEVAIGNNERLSGDINYGAILSYYNHQDDLATRETGALFSVYGEKWISGKHPVSLKVITDFSTLRDTASRDLHNFFLQPSITFRESRYTVKIGGNIASSNDEYFFFPQVEGSFKIVGNHIIAFAGAKGSLRKNNFLTLSNYNPYIHERVMHIRNTRYTDYYSGVKGRFKIVEYEGKVTYSNTKDLALFLHSENDSRKFQPVYDDVNIFRIEGVVRGNPLKGLEVGGTIAKMFYDLATQEEAWHLPGFETRLFASYLTNNGKLRLKGDLFIENGVPYLNEANQPDRLNSLFDLSLSVDYYIIENFGLFGQINNIAANKRQRWLRYPNYGVNAIGGILVRF